MNAIDRTFSRRGFLAGAAALMLAFDLKGSLALAEDAPAAAPLPFAPNAFIRIGADGKVTIVSSYLEMGQGVFTGVATQAADELDVDWSMVEVAAAPADVTHYANPVFAKYGMKVQGTGGSSSMAGSWTVVRKAAAAARAMLLAAAAESWSVPVGELTIVKGTIGHAATGRSSGFGAFVDLASRQPVPTDVVLKAPDAFRLIGQRNVVRRLDIPEKVNGKAIYTQDIKLPGMLVAVVAHPPKLWSRVKSVDDTKAKAIPGVVAVVPFEGDSEVQAGVAVLAKNTWVARQGRDALDIVWDEGKAFTMSSDGVASHFLALADQNGVVAATRGAVMEAVPSGGKMLEAVYHQPYLAHAAMEPLNCLVRLRADGADIWNGEQFHTVDQANVAKELGCKPEQVKIVQLYAGGSFGRRANPRSDYVREAVKIAKAARAKGIDAPIKMVYMREDDMRAGQYRPQTVHRVRAVLDGQGKLASWHQWVVGQSFSPLKSATAVDSLLVEGAADMPYDIPNFRVDQHSVADVAVPTQWLRSVGHTHTAFVGETMIDQLAQAAGQDPYRFRRAMLDKSPRDRGVLDLAAQKAGWTTPLAPGAPGEKRARGIALQKAFDTFVAQVAEVTVRPDGTFSIDRVVCAVDCGVAVNPEIIEAQIEGGVGFGLSFLRQAITFADGEVEQGNFNDYPVLRMNAMPKVEVHIVASSENPTGVGEPGVPPVAPAAVNAIAAATGQTIRSLPLGDRVGVT